MGALPENGVAQDQATVLKRRCSPAAATILYLWLHAPYFLGLAQAIIGALLASDLISPHTTKVLTLWNLVLMAVTGYIKANPPPRPTIPVPT